MIKVASANVAGLRGATITGKAAKIDSGFDKWFKKYKPDLLGLQETKVTPEDKDYEKALNQLGFDEKEFILFPDKFKKGHAGVGTYVNTKKLEILKYIAPFENCKDAEKLWFSGRWLEVYLKNKKTSKNFIFINAYFHHADSPTSMSRDGVLIDRKKSEQSMYSKHKFMEAVSKRLRELSIKNDIILVGDVNIAHKNIDIKNYKGNTTKAGFLPEERVWLDLFFAERKSDTSNLEEIYNYNPDINYRPPKTDEFKLGGLGLIDVFREKLGEKEIYTWWTNMGKAFDNDSGWRIDYQITTPFFASVAHNVKVHKQESYAKRYSDHAPLTIEYNL